MMLTNSRAKRASLAKLHIINDAVRADRYERLKAMAAGAVAPLPWSFQVEPAFARAVDLVVGEKLAMWTKTGGRAAIQLTKAGLEAANAVMCLEGTLEKERVAIADLAREISEQSVAKYLAEGLKI